MKILYKRIFFFSLLIFFDLSLSFSQTGCEVFREDFNGSTTFQEILFPYGQATQLCLYAYSAVYRNNGTEHYAIVTSFMEASLKKQNLNLPFGTYQITLKWRTGIEYAETSDCTAMHYDDLFGATCMLPNRLLVINQDLAYERPGYANNSNNTSVMYYTGKIDSILLPLIGGCAVDPYYTYYDYLSIKNTNVLPQITFGHTVQDSIVFFTDSTPNGDNTPPLWDFGDGTTSTEANPQHTYPFIDSTYRVCLTRKNSCGTYTACKDVHIGGIPDSLLPWVNFTYLIDDTVVYFYDSSENTFEDTPYWDFGDATFSNELDPVHTYPNIDKDYQVCLTRSNQNGSKQRCETVEIRASMLAIKSHTSEKLRVYPNPARDRLFIESSESTELMIYNAQGRLIDRIQVSKGISSAELKDHPNGLYFFRTVNGSSGKIMTGNR